MKCRLIPPPSRNGSGERRATGLTLLDLILVVMITGTLAAVGVPSMLTTLTDIRLSAAADEIITAVEYAQMTALAGGCETRVSIDVAADTVSVEKAGVVLSAAVLSDAQATFSSVETTAFERMEHPMMRGSAYVLSLSSQGALGGVDITAVDLGGVSKLIFDARGTPSSGGTVQLESEGRQLVISIDPQAGRATAP